jgi:hypothetical protein
MGALFTLMRGGRETVKTRAQLLDEALAQLFDGNVDAVNYQVVDY